MTAEHNLQMNRKAGSYLEVLAVQPAAKLALVTDDAAYTYGDLVQQALAIRRALGTGAVNKPKAARFIHQKSIVRQLLEFIACSGTDLVPVIATEASQNQQFDIGKIPDAACMGVMTSGSTGKSKLLWRSYHSWADFFPVQDRIFGIDKNTVIFCQGSLAFTGNLNIYMDVLAAGGTIIAAEKFRPRSWLHMLEQYGANTIYLIPSKLMLLPKFMQLANNKVRRIISGSQSMGRAEAERLAQVFLQAQLVLYYGASELNYISYIDGGQMTDDRTLIGRPFPGVGVTVQDEEIFVHTAYGVEGITLPFSLKDRGRLDEDGQLHFLGRKDDICNVNGIKIAAVKVEAALTQALSGTVAGEAVHEAEAAVVALRSGDADVLTAFVAGGLRCTRQELLALLRPQLTDYEIPRQIVYLDELPKNESGKIDKMQLIKEYGNK